VTVLGLARLDHQYLLYGIAAAICLVVFVTLILTPALSSYGRVWEKAAAGVMAVLVLAALVLCGVVVGLVVVYYYTDILNVLHGE
jgi:hydrogenase-4 membrane subunit HyfE